MPDFDWTMGASPSIVTDEACTRIAVFYFAYCGVYIKYLQTSTDLTKLKDAKAPFDSAFLDTLNSSTSPCQMAVSLIKIWKILGYMILFHYFIFFTPWIILFRNSLSMLLMHTTATPLREERERSEMQLLRSLICQEFDRKFFNKTIFVFQYGSCEYANKNFKGKEECIAW